MTDFFIQKNTVDVDFQPSKNVGPPQRRFAEIIFKLPMIV